MSGKGDTPRHNLTRYGEGWDRINWGRDMEIDGKTSKRMPDGGSRPPASTNLADTGDTPRPASKVRRTGRQVCPGVCANS